LPVRCQIQARIKPPPGAWDTHAHIFGPSDKFPYQPGRGYTPPDAPVERFVALLDHLGFSNGLVVQGNAHVYDNSVVLDALTRFPGRLRGVAITDARIKPEVLREWHDVGMRGLRFHLFPQRPNYIRGVGLDVFEVFRKTMADLGWVVQFFCDHRMLAPTAPALHDISREMTVIVDHLGMVPASQGVNDPNFHALLKLVGDGHAYVKLSAVYRLSAQFSRLSGRQAAARCARSRQSGAADVGHRLAASVDPGRGHARRWAFAEPFSRLDAGRTNPSAHSGGYAGATVREVTHLFSSSLPDSIRQSML
jgi:predicted TIM-barrel fold metal-dependent hydrolase